MLMPDLQQDLELVDQLVTFARGFTDGDLHKDDMIGLVHLVTENPRAAELLEVCLDIAADRPNPESIRLIKAYAVSEEEIPEGNNHERHHYRHLGFSHQLNRPSSAFQ